MRRWKPGNSCCKKCSIFSDDYSTDRTGTDYHTSAGSWAVSGGVLTCTTASALLRCETAAAASGITALYASATFSCSSTSDIARLILLYTDDNNYWFVEAKPGATNGTLELYQRSGGTNTLQGSTQTFGGLQAGTTATICLSYTGSIVLATGTIVGSVKCREAVNATITVTSTKAGLGTGAGSSSVTFDDFLFSNHNTDNNKCGNCDACSACNGTVPSRMQIDISGLTNNSNSCADSSTPDCAKLNATFVVKTSLCTPLTNNLSPHCDPPEGRSPAVNQCRWTYQGSIAGKLCASDFAARAGIDLILDYNTGTGTYGASMDASTQATNTTTPNCGLYWQQTFHSSVGYGSSQPNCNSFSGEVISNSNTGTGLCSLGSLVVTATAL
jgi:hypothetical protein